MTQSWKKGACHCGAVRWEAETADDVIVDACNCSICARVGYQHLIVAADKFRLLNGGDQLTEYSFNTGVARHLFCKCCGVKSFYVPRSHPEGYSLNFRCMDPKDFASVEIRPFDGENWEKSAPALPPLGAE